MDRYTGARLVLAAFTDSLKFASAFASVVDGGLITRVPIGHSVGQIMSGASAATEVAAASAIPVRKLDVSGTTCPQRKVGAMIVMSVEFLRDAPQAAEATISRELRNSVAAGIDSAFVATLLSGVQEFTASGDPLDDARNLLQAVGLTTASRGFWVCGPDAGILLSTHHTGGQRHAPDVGPTGGSLLGIPLFVADAPGFGDSLLLADGARLAGNLGGAEIAHSRQALVESDTAPAGGVLPGSPGALETLGATAQVSLWQQNLEAIRLLQYFGITRLSASAVAAVYMGGSPP